MTGVYSLPMPPSSFLYLLKLCWGVVKWHSHLSFFTGKYSTVKPWECSGFFQMLVMLPYPGCWYWSAFGPNPDLFMLWRLWAIGRSVNADLLHELSWVMRGLSWIWQIKLLLIIQVSRRYSQPSHGLVLPLLTLKGVFSSSALGSAPAFSPMAIFYLKLFIVCDPP